MNSRAVGVANANRREVLRLFGEKVSANFGWGQGEDFFETKVYGVPPCVIKTVRATPRNFTHFYFYRASAEQGWLEVDATTICRVRKLKGKQ